MLNKSIDLFQFCVCANIYTPFFHCCVIFTTYQMKSCIKQYSVMDFVNVFIYYYYETAV